MDEQRHADSQTPLPGQPPDVGDIVYLPAERYLSRGRDDRAGGKARVTAIREDLNRGRLVWWVSVEAFPGVKYNWTDHLEPIQADLADRFKDDWAKPDPDLRPQFNEPW